MPRSGPLTPRCVAAILSIVAGTSVLLQVAGGAAASAGRVSTVVEPGVVDVTARLAYQSAATIGTGMVITQSGEVLTNNHVIRGATSIRVSDVDSGRTYAATVVGYDPVADVAVLKLANASGLATVTIGSSSKARLGDAVTAIGNAGGNGGTPSRTTGRIDALDQSITAIDDDGNAEQLNELIEVTAELQPGDSGGPLVNGAGQVIGMDTAGSGHFAFQNVNNDGFAIPIDRAISIANRIEHGHSSAAVHVGPTAFLGVNIESPGNDAGGREIGALVTGVVASTPAGRAGIVRDDIIFAVDGHTIGSPAALTNRIVAKAPGATVVLRWVDKAGKTHRASVRLASGPPQ